MSLIRGKRILGDADNIWFPRGGSGGGGGGGGTINEPFTYANGTTSIPGWTVVLPGGTTGGIVDVQSNRLRINTPNISFDAPYLRFNSAIATLDLSGTFLFNPGAAVAQYPSINYRYTTVNQDGQPDQGYDFYFARNENQVGWETRTASATAASNVQAFSWTNDIEYGWRIVFNGSSHKLWVWALPGSRPTTGGTGGANDGSVISQSNAAHSSGNFALVHGAQNANREAFFDTLVGTYS